jgi:hypothetical protein
LRNLALLARLNEAEQRVLDTHGPRQKRHRREDGSFVATGLGELRLLLAYEETDWETITWLEWFDLTSDPRRRSSV